MKKPYEELRHSLDNILLKSDSIGNQTAQQDFVTQAFVEIHQLYKAKDISYDAYIKLVNRLASYKQGKFNDYLDMLIGSAQFGMLDSALKHSLSASANAEAQKRGTLITNIFGIQPSKPDTSK